MTADDEEARRVLVLLVTYQAEPLVPSMLARIPAELISNPRFEILLIADACSDDGVALARRWAEDRRATNVTILTPSANQGYGGNQKLAYRIAVDARFDLVILLHGELPCTPQLLDRFVEIRKATGADVILGTRLRALRPARERA